MNGKAIESTVLNKILVLASEYTVLAESKRRLTEMPPASSLLLVRKRLKRTEECVELLFTHGVSTVEYFPAFEDELQRAQKGSTLSLGELLKVEKLLRSARIARSSVIGFIENENSQMREIVDKIYYDERISIVYNIAFVTAVFG